MLFLTAIRAASEIVIPIVLAFVLKLVLRPLQRFLQRMHVHQTVAAVLIVMMLVGSLCGLANVLSTPAMIWAEKIPTSISKLEKRLHALNTPFESAQKLVEHAESMTQSIGPEVVPVAVQGTRLSDKILSGATELISALFATFVMLFFLLAAGDTFLRRLVEVLPKFSDKRHAVDISQQIEHDISIYLLTITFMNALVGIATGLIMTAYGREDALLWGTVAFLLNYVPILGPMIGVAIFLMAGLVASPFIGPAVMPAFLYLCVHLVENNFITPMLLSRRFTLNPVLVIVSLLFWYWMWGFPGAILAVPMLAVIKIICDRIEKLKPFGHFLEG